MPPTLKAYGTVNPYKMVYVTSGATFSVAQTPTTAFSSLDQVAVVGVNGGNTCTTGQTVTLQSGDIVILTAGNTIGIGQLLDYDVGGVAISIEPPFSGNDRHKYYQALQNAISGQTFYGLKTKSSYRINSSSPIPPTYYIEL